MNKSSTTLDSLIIEEEGEISELASQDSKELKTQEKIIINSIEKEIEGTIIRNQTITNERRKGSNMFKLSEEGYDEFQIPPSLKTAELHYKSTRIGLPFTRKDTSIKHEICPCCLRIKRELFPKNQNPREILNYGNTIPLYFSYFHYITIVIFLIMIPSLIDFFINAYAFCELNLNSDNKCEFSLKIFYYYTENVKKDKKKFTEFLSYNSIFGLFINFLLYFFDIYYYQFHLNLISKLKKIKKRSASDFTIMISNLTEENDEQFVKNFIEDSLSKCDIPNVNIIKVNIASYIGNLNILINKIEKYKQENSSILTFLHDIEKIKFEKKSEKKLREKIKKILLRKIKKNEKMVDKLGKESNYVSKKWLKKTSLRKHMLAFVTVNTVEEKIDILKANFKKEKEKKCTDFCFKLNSFTRNRKMRVFEAPEPDQIQWEFIGYSKSERNLSYFVSLLLLSTSLLIFILILYSVTMTKLAITEGSEEFYIKIFNLVMSLCLVLIGKFFKKILDLITRREKYLTKDLFLTSKTNRMIVLKLLTIFFSVLIYYVKYNGTKTIVYRFILSYFTSVLFAESIIAVLHPRFLWKKFKRWKTKLGILNGNPKYFIPQRDLMDVFERVDCDLDQKYSLIFSVALISIFTFGDIPITPFICFLFFVIKYKIDKILFIRRYKIPSSSSEKLFSNVVFYSGFFPLVFQFNRIFYNDFDFYRSRENYYYVFLTFGEVLLIILHFIPLKKILFRNFKEKIFEEQSPGALLVDERSRKTIYTGQFSLLKKDKKNKKLLEKLKKKLQKMRRKKKKYLKKANGQLDNLTINKALMEEILSLKYKDLYIEFEGDYDRMNPITREKAFKEWFEERFKRLVKMKTKENDDSSDAIFGFIMGGLSYKSKLDSLKSRDYLESIDVGNEL